MKYYKFKWDMTEQRFCRLKTDIEIDNEEGCYGNVYIGNYCIDIMLNSDYVYLNFFRIGVDSGYGYTGKNQTPYDFEDKLCCSFRNDDVLKLSFEDFKHESEHLIIKEFIGCKEKDFLEKEVYCPVADWT